MGKTFISLGLALGLLANAGVVVTAQDDGESTPQLVTEVMEPGVERVVSDGAGHDCAATPPEDPYDLDGIAITPDGDVWLTASYHGDDATSSAGPLIWTLGRPGIYRQEHGLPVVEGPLWLLALDDGTLLAITGRDVLRFDGERFVPDDGPSVRRLADGRPLVLVRQEGSASMPLLVWVGNVGDLISDALAGHREVAVGSHSCWVEGLMSDDGGRGITCQRWIGAEPVTYLADTVISQIAAAPDGSLWAVGDCEGGGLYRITLG